MHPSRISLICWSGLFVIQGLLASNSMEEDEKVEAMLQGYVNSQGGRERLLTITSIEVDGIMKLESQGLRIPMAQKVQAPDKVYTMQDFPVFGEIRNSLNGNQGWEWHPIAGERPLDYTEVDELLDDANLQRDLNLRDEYSSILLGPPEIIEDIQTTQLIFTDEAGKVEYWYFKSNGDLFQKIHIVSAGPESEFEATERYYDFEEEEGFRFPRKIRYLNPAYEAELTITELVINREIDQCYFVLPIYAEEMARLAKDEPYERSSTTVD